MERILITGIKGFVGPYLKRELEAHDFEVFGLGREEGSGNKYYQADILDAERIAKIVAEVCPTHIAHLAGFSSPAEAEKQPQLVYNVNFRGTENVFIAAAGMKERPRILVVSSAHVYGQPKYLPITEEHPLKGKGAYAKSRIAQEMLVSDWCSELSINVARSFNHTGPGQSDTMVLPKAAKQIVELKLGKRKALELGNIYLRRDLSDVRDVVRAYCLLLMSDVKNVTVNVCRGESMLLRDMVESMARLTGLADVPIITDTAAIRADDPPDVYGSHDKLTALTGWRPEISYEEMIMGVYKYWNNIRIY